MRRPLLAVLAFCILCSARGAGAQWQDPGVVVARPLPPFVYFGEARLISAPDGSVFALGSGSTASTEYWDTQRTTAQGALTPSWPGFLTTSINATTNGPGLLTKIGLGFASSGDLVTSWGDGSSTTVHHQRLTGYAGATPTLLDRSFVNPFTWKIGFTALVPTVGDETYIYYGAAVGGAPPRLTRRTAAGSVSSGWPVNGKRVFSASALDGALLPDGAGGVVASERTTTLEFRVTRVNADTTFAAGWSASGLLLSSNVDFSDEQSFPQLLPSGGHGYIACWPEMQATTTPPTREISLMRFLDDGTLDPAWGSGLQIAFQSSGYARFTVLPDGAGGAFVLFENLGEPRGTHVLASGVIDPAQGAADVSLLDAGAQYIGLGPVSRPFRFPLAAAAGKNGGLILVWNDIRDYPAGSLRARWMTSALQADPTEPAVARRIPTATSIYEDVRAAVSDGASGLYVAWGDLPATESYAVFMMTRVLASEFLGAPRPAHATALSLSAPRPNPTRGSVAFDVTLPDESPARVELLDVAGRVQRSQTVEGAGAHAVSFRDLGTLAPGLYFARASHPHGIATTRVIIAR
jgi:hypothetical protein